MIDRNEYLGSSDIAAILGVSKWSTPYGVWERKVGVAAEQPANPQRDRALRRGSLLEPYITDILEKDHDFWITSRNKRYVDPEFSFLRAEVDAESEDFDGTITNVEIKTVHPYALADWGQEGTDEVPTYYVAQIQFALMVTGRQKCIVAALVGGDELRLYYVHRDEQVIQHIRVEAVRFWNNHVVAGVAPPPANSADADKWLRHFNGVTLEADDETRDQINELVELKALVKGHTEQAEAISEELKVKLARTAATDPASEQVAIIDSVDRGGKTLLTWNQQTTKRLEVSAVKEKFPEAYEQCQKASSFRVMRIKEKNL